MNLVEYLTKRLGDRAGQDLTAAGPTSQQLLNTVGNESTTRALIAGAFWHAVLYGLPRWRKRVRATYRWDGHQFVREPRDGIEPYVVSHTQQWPGRHDLVIFDPRVDDDEVSDVEIRDSDLMQGWDAAPAPSS